MSTSRRNTLIAAAAAAALVAGAAVGCWAVRASRAKRKSSGANDAAAAAPTADAAPVASSSTTAPAAAAAASASLPYTLLLFDIEGTTTPISFVKEILFPYVSTHLASYLEQTYESAQTRADIQALIELAENDRAAGANAPLIPRFPSNGVASPAFRTAQITALVANVSWQMSSDRKSTALKQLQGHMWRKGYENGTLKGALFGGASGDVAQQLRAWHTQGYRLGVYSSGSVGAQKLLFAHSDSGDLTPLFCVHFDTTVGMKQESASYAAIAKSTGVSPDRILFFTDIWAEAWAAHQAGVAAVLLDRPGNYALPPEQSSKHSFPIAKDFREVEQMMQQKSRGEGPLAVANAADDAATAATAAAASTSSASGVDVSTGQFNTF